MWRRMLIVLFPFSGALGLSACNPGSFQLEDHQCIRETQFDDGIRRYQIVDGPRAKVISGTEKPLNVLDRTVWTLKQIPVCWEADTADASDREKRTWVRGAVESSWNSILSEGAELLGEEPFQFTGWGICEGETPNSIRIAIDNSEEAPRVIRLGKELAGIPAGMLLKFDFAQWGRSCAEPESFRSCIEKIAVHEFGHALGFAHEQNRNDTPESCDQGPQGSTGNRYMGEWDQNSVMNYCSKDWINDGKLTDSDRLWAVMTYYPELLQAVRCAR